MKQAKREKRQGLEGMPEFSQADDASGTHLPKGGASPSLSWEMGVQSLFHMKDYLNSFKNHLLFNQGIHIKKSKKITLAASGLSIALKTDAYSHK